MAVRIRSHPGSDLWTAMSAKRPRFSGSDDQLVEIFRQHVIKTTSLFYGTDKGSKRSPKHLLKAKEFIRAVHDVQPNLSLTKSQVTRCMKERLKDETWWGDDKEKVKFIETVVERVMAICRDARRGRASNRNAPWVQAIFDAGTQAERGSCKVGDNASEDGKHEEEGGIEPEEEEEENQGEDSSGKEMSDDEHSSMKDEPMEAEPSQTSSSNEEDEPPLKKPTMSAQWNVGFDPEQRQPWRSTSMQPKAFREYTSMLQLPSADAKDNDCMIAIWPDGFRHPLTEITVQAWKTEQDSRRAKLVGNFNRRITRKGAFTEETDGNKSEQISETKTRAKNGDTKSVKWSGKQIVNGDRVAVVQKHHAMSDGSKQFLLSLQKWEGKQNCQQCQCLLPSGRETEWPAFCDVMQVLAEEVCSGRTTTKAACKIRRDDLLMERGLIDANKMNREKQLKKPAAATASLVSCSAMAAASAAPSTPAQKASSKLRIGTRSPTATADSDSDFSEPIMGIVEEGYNSMLHCRV